ncbi:MAG: SAM-dependent methyltransferase [Gemmatimonadetes bacterium]|nr:SAM-dependent methyltransferase [Gemmatimonadota bacterium]
MAEEPPPWGLRAALAPLEQALLDAHRGLGEGLVRMRTDPGGEEAFPAALLLRDPSDLLPLDRAALAHARGRVLDVGAGGGAVALAFQAAGHPVTALEIMPGAVEVMRARGVDDAREGDVWRFRAEGGYDTVVALMNGTGLAGTLERLPSFLVRLASFVGVAGQVLLDSTDPGEESGSDGRHPGELHYQLAYGDAVGAPFPYLLVAPTELAGAAGSVGLTCEVVAEDGEGSYLARLSRGLRPAPPASGLGSAPTPAPRRRSGP